MPANIPTQEEIDAFLPAFKPTWKLDVDNPIAHGNIIGTQYYEKLRKAMQDAQEEAKTLIPKIAKEWEKEFGRNHGGLFELYRCEDAEYILISMAAIGAESKVAIDHLRDEGISIGLARLRVLRPFPTEEVIKLGKQAELIVIDRNISVGNEGAMFTEIKSALYRQSDAKVTGFIAGLGGKDVPFGDIEKMCKQAIKGKTMNHQIWYGFEEGE